MGMMGAASMTPAASQQPAMTPSGGTNMGKAMYVQPKKNHLL